MNDTVTYRDRMRWFHEARFGMFIHLGLYSLLERGEWVMYRERIRPADYELLADRFTAERFDARAWAALARDAGMKYMMLTARHHDGYCLYDSKVSTFTSTKSAARRDFVAEYVDACRAAGLKVGIYYSLLDWRYPGYFEPKLHPQSAAAMVQQAREQVRELMTEYGQIDVLWYDGEWISHGKYKDVQVAEFWRSVELNEMVRKLQPNIIINNRSGTKEDIDTPEQHVTASEPGRGWESCMTIGHPAGWGYIRHVPDFKGVSELIQNLCKAASGEGNFLLNVGPQADGIIRNEEVDILNRIGDWLGRYGKGIYGSQRCDLPNDSQPGAANGWWTRKGNTAYLFIPRWTGETLVVPYVASEAVRATVLGMNRPLSIQREYNGRLVLRGLPKDPPDAYTSVIEIEFSDIPRTQPEPDASAWLTDQA